MFYGYKQLQIYRSVIKTPKTSLITFAGAGRGFDSAINKAISLRQGVSHPPTSTGLALLSTQSPSLQNPCSASSGLAEHFLTHHNPVRHDMNSRSQSEDETFIHPSSLSTRLGQFLFFISKTSAKPSRAAANLRHVIQQVLAVCTAEK